MFVGELGGPKRVKIEQEDLDRLLLDSWEGHAVTERFLNGLMGRENYEGFFRRNRWDTGAAKGWDNRRLAVVLEARFINRLMLAGMADTDSREKFVPLWNPIPMLDMEQRTINYLLGIDEERNKGLFGLARIVRLVERKLWV